MGDRQSSKSKKGLIGIGLVIAILVFLGSRLFNGKIKLNPVEYVTIEVEGFDGDGVAQIDFDTERLISDLAQKKALTDRDHEVIELLLSDAYRDVALSSTSELSNGDTIKIETRLDKKLLDSYGVKLKNGTAKYKVENLAPYVDLSLTDYITITTDGYDGAGKAAIHFNTEQLAEDLEEDFIELNRGLYEPLTENDDPGEAAAMVASFVRDYWTRYFTPEISDCEELSNGDTVTLTITQVEDVEPVIPSYGINLSCVSQEITVEDLEEPLEIDLAECLNVQFSGVCPRVNVEVDYGEWESFYNATSLDEIYGDNRICAFNGDKFEGEISYDEDQMKAYGVKVTNNAYSFEISGLNSYKLSCTSLEDALLQPFIEETLKASRNKLIQERNRILENSGISQGWLLYDQIQTALESGTFVYKQTDDEVRNLLMLVIHGVVPVRLVDRRAVALDVYELVYLEDAQETPDGELVYEEVNRCLYYDKKSLSSDMEEIIDEMSDEETVERTDMSAENVIEIDTDSLRLAEVTKTATEEAQADENHKQMNLMDLYAVSSRECWQATDIQDTYGNLYGRSMQFIAGKNSAVVYELNEEWSTLSGILSTWSKAQSEAAFDLVIWGDQEIIYSRYNYKKTDAAEEFLLDVSGVRKLYINTTLRGSSSGNDGSIFIHEPVLTGKKTSSDAGNESVKVEALSQVCCLNTVNWEGQTDEGIIVDEQGAPHRDYYVMDCDNPKSWDDAANNPVGGTWYLNGEYTSFKGNLVVSSNGNAPVSVQILADGEVIFTEQKVKSEQGVLPVSVDLTGRKILEIQILCDQEKDEPDVYLYETEMIRIDRGDIGTKMTPAVFPELSADVASQVAGEMICGNRKFYCFEQKVSWQEAAVYCMSAGGALAVPRSEEENYAIADMLYNVDHGEHWLGALRKEGYKWVTTSGQELSKYKNWESGHPSSSSERKHFMTISSQGSWFDREDTELRGFVMEVEAVEPRQPEIQRLGTKLTELTWSASENCKTNRIYFANGEHRADTLYFKAENKPYLEVALNGKFTDLTGVYRMDPYASPNADVSLAVFGDGRCLYEAKHLKGADGDIVFDIDVTGVKNLSIRCRNVGDTEDDYLYLSDVYLVRAKKPAVEKVARLGELTCVDMDHVSAESKSMIDAYGNLHERYLYLEANSQAAAVYSLNGEYTCFEGTLVCGESKTRYEGDMKIAIFGDNEELETITMNKASGPVAFSVDLSGRKVLKIQVESLDGKSNVLYLTEDRLM